MLMKLDWVLFSFFLSILALRFIHLWLFQVVASGIFIPGFGPCLADPCERGKVSATPGMTRQQAEELTVSAQKYLRMMHFNKIHLVLDMEPLPRKVGWDKRKNKKSEGDKKESEEAAKDEEMKTS